MHGPLGRLVSEGRNVVRPDQRELLSASCEMPVHRVGDRSRLDVPG
jgi:hypothetical protein